VTIGFKLTRPSCFERASGALGTLLAVACLASCSSSLPVSMDQIAQGGVSFTISTLYSSAGGTDAASFKGVSLTSIRAHSEWVFPTSRSVSRASTVNHIDVSVNLCANGPSCTELVVTARGSDEQCWYQRQSAGSLSQRNVIGTVGAFAVATSPRACSSRAISGLKWQRQWPHT
jgi:hypothetical protein